MIFKIVIPGGPGAGKTTICPIIGEILEERGYHVIIVEEAATKLINSGIRPFGDNAIPLFDFQQIVIPYQLKLEKQAIEEAKEYEKCVILYDRGLLDNKAYCETDEEWKTHLSKFGLNHEELYDRYDMTLFLSTPAYCKNEHYTTENNKARSEDVELAKIRDTLTLEAYIGHPNLKIIEATENFQDKIDNAVNCVLAELNEPGFYNNQYKFSVDLSSSNIDKLKENAVKSYITQTYLKSDEDLDIKVRKRWINGKITYYYIAKRKLNGKEEIIKKTIISEKDYFNYLKNRDESRKTIRKIRYSFKVNRDIYNLDVFPNSNYGILESEANKDIKDLVLPDFLNIVDYSQGNQENQNKHIALRRVKERV